MSVALPPAARRALGGHIAAALGVPTARIRRAQPLAGGAIHRHWLLHMEGAGREHARLVLRLAAANPPPCARSIAAEYAVHRAMVGAGVLTPRPLLRLDSVPGPGLPGYVMTHARGVSAARKVAAGWGARAGPALLAEIGAALARIHRVSSETPEGDPARAAIRRFRAGLDAGSDAGGGANPMLELALRWLAERAPPPGARAMLHRDYRTANLLVSSGRLSAVLDWEFAAAGDPHEDLAWFCAACWRGDTPAREAGGLGEREALYGAYERAGGVAVSPGRVHFWEVAAHLRWAIIAAAQARRCWDLGERDLQLGLLAWRGPAIERALLTLMDTAP